MSLVQIEGYLGGSYLVGPYMAGIASEVTGMQVEAKIVDPTDDLFLGSQVEMIADKETPQGMQVEGVIVAQERVGMQVDGRIITPAPQGMQSDLRIDGTEINNGMQVKIFPLAHWLHPKYLTEPEGYLTEGYLSEKMCAFQGMQVEGKIISAADDFFLGMQSELKIVDQNNITGMQSEGRIFRETEQGMQVNMIRQFRLGQQANLVIYNVTQLRILCEFPSRGVSNQYGSNPVSVDNANWFTPQTLRGGDLGKLSNLNTDVVEERVQTVNGTTVWELRCDTGAGNTFVDTLALLNHNITTSATVVVQGSDDQNFGTVKFQFNVPATQPYAIYIAPELPTVAARYYRIIITDTTNPDDFLRIGTIIFGSSKILSLKECFDNPVTFGKRHFKDQVKTSGFTNKSNDRATRRILGLRFSQIDVEGGNYKLLQDYMDFAKTDLKCLIIPTPTKPTILTVWSKLVSLPEEQHNAIDVTNDELNAHWVDLDLDWDEGE